MQTEILIIGQGISGTMLSWHLQKANIPFLVMDDNRPNAASKVAAGIINPVTGRRVVKTWMIDRLLPYALKAYTDFGVQFGIPCVSEKKIIDFFPTLQMQEAFAKSVIENSDYLRMDTAQDFKAHFHYQHDFGIIAPALIVDLKKILYTWRLHLEQQQLFVPDDFKTEDIIYAENEIRYKDIRAKKIIFADGAGGAANKWFKNLPYAPNKGEALCIEAAELDRNFIYKKGITLAPVGEKEFWVGANYLWDYADDQPTAKFYAETKIALDSFLKVPYTITGHFAAIRPANIERRPFVGFHPGYKNIGIFNGMGAKGTALAPYFANAFTNHILHQTAIEPEASIERFTKVLSR